LAHLLNQPEIENALIFARTRHGADRVVKELDSAGIHALAIHGSKSQTARQDALNQFKSGRISALVATDIAARGIDIAGLSHVINYDLPHEPEVYIHRIGRTGRAGLSGDAISFCSIDEVKDLGQIEALIGRRIPTLESAWPMEVFTPAPPKAANTNAPARLNMKGEPARARTPRYSEPGRSAGGSPSGRPSGQNRFGGGRAGDQPARPARDDRFGGRSDQPTARDDRFGGRGDQPGRPTGQDRFSGGRTGDQPRPARDDRFGGGRVGDQPRPARDDRFGGGRAGGRPGGRPFDGARRSGGGRPGDRKR
jgi:superfamily II DNA/RNA helicase